MKKFKNVTIIKYPVFIWDVENECVALNDIDRNVTSHVIRTYKFSEDQTIEDLIEDHKDYHIVICANNETLYWDYNKNPIKLPNINRSFPPKPTSDKRVRICLIDKNGKSVVPYDSEIYIEGKAIRKSDFIREIESGGRPEYHIRVIDGVKTPFFNPGKPKDHRD
jgi:hypothetical protein